MDIQVKDISKIYGAGENQVAALRNASMTIHAGDFISIIGPSGSGKSTLLHIVSGLDQPTSGKVLYGDTNIHKGSDKELSAFRRQKIGFIFQQFNLLPVLTARENIIMPLLLDKKQPDEAYLKQLTELLGLTERLSHLPHELSGGQQQRVAIARALIAQPDIIFADEPTGNLDSKSGGEVMKMLCDIREKLGKTLVIITHDSRIAKMADPYLKHTITPNDLSCVQFNVAGNIFIGNPSACWIPELTVSEEISGTIYTVTGSYEGTESFLRKLERIATKKFTNQLEVDR